MALHQKSSFPLIDAYLAVPCNECHKPKDASKTAIYHFVQLSCTSCHEDIHNGQFTQRVIAEARTANRLDACSVIPPKNGKIRRSSIIPKQIFL
jgi:hypothetical protein